MPADHSHDEIANYTYLTNASGEQTGNGVVSDVELALCPFEQGPGFVLSYLVAVDDESYLKGHLEVVHQDDFWRGDDSGFFTRDEAQSFCAEAATKLNGRIECGARVLPIEDDMPGRFVVGVLIPLKELRSSGHALEVLARVFGEFAHLDRPVGKGLPASEA